MFSIILILWKEFTFNVKRFHGWRDGLFIIKDQSEIRVKDVNSDIISFIPTDL